MLQLNFSRAQSVPAEDWATTEVTSCQALVPGVKTKVWNFMRRQQSVITEPVKTTDGTGEGERQ